ncbi:MAG TPA: glycosyltransferase [Magnetospirillaceae bacterium]|nr:glycosyltransferase [Magnetospirillaceae bacterium]
MIETKPETNPLVSLIVTTKNSGAVLRACLESARRQDHAPLEIIVVDNGSSDDTLQIANELADVVLQAGPERSAQRNAGIRAARGRFVAILDSDMVLDPDVVSSCLAAAERSGARGICIPEESFGPGFWSRCKAFERDFYRFDQTVTAARFFEREHILELGGYDETMTGTEDWDMSIRALGAARMVFCTGLIRHDEGRQTLALLFAKKYYYARALPQFVRKHGKAAMARLTPMRRALLVNAGQFVRHPVLGGGLIVMKSWELAGAVFGLLDRRPRHPGELYGTSQASR